MLHLLLYPLLLLFQCAIHAEAYTYYSYEECIAVDGFVSSLDFSLEFPDVEEMMFTLPTPLPLNNAYPQNDLGISKNIHVNLVFFTCHIGSAPFLKFADMPGVKHFRWIVDEDTAINWKEISSAFPCLETIELDFSTLQEVELMVVLQGLENVSSAKRLNLTTAYVSAVLTLETADQLSHLQQFEEINITITSYCNDENHFAKTYQELLQDLLPNAKISVQSIKLYTQVNSKIGIWAA